MFDFLVPGKQHQASGTPGHPLVVGNERINCWIRNIERNCKDFFCSHTQNIIP